MKPKQSNRRLVVAGITFPLLGLLFALFYYGVYHGDNPKELPKALLGKEIPRFSVVSLDGATIDQATTVGKPTIINFWASWCLPCKEEAPHLEAVWREYGTDKIAIIGIASNDKLENIERFVREFGLTFTTALDTENQIMLDFGVAGLPETLLVDPSGKIEEKIVGAVNYEEMKAFLDKYI